MAKPKSAFSLRFEYVMAAGLVGAMRVLPLTLAAPLSRMCARILDVALPKLRRTARTNLSFALPQLDPIEQNHVIDGVFRGVARLLLAVARMPDINAANVHDWIRYEGLEHYQQAKLMGRGVLVATAHLGNWELSAFAHALMTEPMNVMVRPLDNPLVDRMVETRRQLSGDRLILKKDAAYSVMRALRNNEAVGILIDQNTAAAEGVFIDFFGRKACAGAAFVKLAARSAAPVIPGFAFWEPRERRHVLRFYPPIPITGDAAADTQRVHSFFEQLIREYPDQWMWIHRRWKTRPDGEAPIY